MGQYFMLVNLDKREYIHPHDVGHPAKLWEICANNLGGVLLFLLRQSDEGGGGDICKDYPAAGRWAGDRITVVGDYDSSNLYDTARREYTDISGAVRDDWNDFIKIDHHKLRNP